MSAISSEHQKKNPADRPIGRCFLRFFIDLFSHIAKLPRTISEIRQWLVTIFACSQSNRLLFICVRVSLLLSVSDGLSHQNTFLVPPQQFKCINKMQYIQWMESTMESIKIYAFLNGLCVWIMAIPSIYILLYFMQNRSTEKNNRLTHKHTHTCIIKHQNITHKHWSDNKFSFHAR